MADTIFKDKTLLITGGTGSFGHTVLKHFLTTDIGEIRIFSQAGSFLRVFPHGGRAHQH